MIDEVKRLVNFYIRKNRYSGRLSGAEFNLLAKSSQIEIINENVRVDGLQRVQHLNDEMIDLKKSASVSKLGDVFTKPSDFMYLVELSHDDSGTIRSIEVLRDSKFNRRVNSVVVAPSTEIAVAKYSPSSFTVSPSSISTLDIEYIKQPADPEWAYTTSSSREVYDAGSSTDFELPEIFLNELAMRILSKLGISTKEGDVVKTANALRNE